MFSYNISDELKKKLKVLGKKDKLILKIFKRKLLEIVSHDKRTISTYKNLKAPLNKYKRIHLTSNSILLFHVDIDHNHIVFVNLLHRDRAYAKK